MNLDAKYPEVKVKLSGEDGNTFSLMVRVTRALCRAGHMDQVDAFTAEALDGDRDHFLQTCMKWVDVT